ncbi:recombinase family protein [Microbacterium trichothecenolyticum]|uniref:recombinase family protein n=1 Tax=Microbacterium trichothecenolyticum TaxID=69370 RepID=UPI00146FECBC|nr:recombinase family protein [Microbacterium trichothecenolyticum]
MTRLVGYTRALTADAGIDADVEALTRAGAVRVFTDSAGTDPRHRYGLSQCLEALGPGDVLVTLSASHLSHAVTHFATTVSALTARGVGFRSLAEPALCTGADQRVDPGEVLAALEALRRRLVSVRTRAGMASAAAAGKRAGRPTVMTPEKVAMAVELRNLGRPITHIARVLGVSANSVQRALAPPTAPDTPSESLVSDPVRLRVGVDVEPAAEGGFVDGIGFPVRFGERPPVHQACRGAGVPAGVEDFGEGFGFIELQAADHLIVVAVKDLLDDVGKVVDRAFQLVPRDDAARRGRAVSGGGVSGRGRCRVHLGVLPDGDFGGAFPGNGVVSDRTGRSAGSWNTGAPERAEG